MKSEGDINADGCAIHGHEGAPTPTDVRSTQHIFQRVVFIRFPAFATSRQKFTIASRTWTTIERKSIRYQAMKRA